MNRFFLAIVLTILSCTGEAQTDDSLFAVRKGGNWAIKYTVNPGETLHMLALRFYLTDIVLEYANEVNVIKKFGPGSVITVPISPENYYVQKQTFVDQRPLYYRVAERDDIATVATYAGVAKQQIRMWNSLKGNTLKPDEVLFVGWIKYMGRDTANPATLLAYPSVRRMAADTAKQMAVPGGLDTVFNRQTSNGVNVLNERGTAVFYEQSGRVRVYYAFHNATPKGAIIKVTNPGTGKSTYVKVVGNLPNTKQYNGAIIGISAAAKEALGVTDSKAWVDLSYSP